MTETIRVLLQRGVVARPIKFNEFRRQRQRSGSESCSGCSCRIHGSYCASTGLRRLRRRSEVAKGRCASPKAVRLSIEARSRPRNLYLDSRAELPFQSACKTSKCLVSVPFAHTTCGPGKLMLSLRQEPALPVKPGSRTNLRAEALSCVLLIPVTLGRKGRGQWIYTRIGPSRTF